MGQSAQSDPLPPPRAKNLLPGARLGSRPGTGREWGDWHAKGTVHSGVGNRCGSDFRDVCNTMGLFPEFMGGNKARDISSADPIAAGCLPALVLREIAQGHSLTRVSLTDPTNT
jgi:hypothetical protein